MLISACLAHQMNLMMKDVLTHPSFQAALTAALKIAIKIRQSTALREDICKLAGKETISISTDAFGGPLVFIRINRKAASCMQVSAHGMYVLCHVACPSRS
jgi:hypothetical protein